MKSKNKSKKKKQILSSSCQQTGNPLKKYFKIKKSSWKHLDIPRRLNIADYYLKRIF
jgi:hypothetical protein